MAARAEAEGGGVVGAEAKVAEATEVGSEAAADSGRQREGRMAAERRVEVLAAGKEAARGAVAASVAAAEGGIDGGGGTGRGE